MDDKLKAEQWLFVLFAASLPLATLFQLKFFGEAVQLSDLLFLATAIVWAFAALIKRNFPPWNWLYFCLAAYALAAVLSTIESSNPAQSAVKLLGKFHLVGIAFLTLNIINSGLVFKRVLQGWIFGAGVVLLLSLAGIILFYAGIRDPSLNIVAHPIFGSLPAGDYPRIEGLFNYPAMLCNYLGVTWMFAILARSAGWLGNRTFWACGVSLFLVNAFTLTPGLGGIFLTTGYFLGVKLIHEQRPILRRTILATGVLIAFLFLFVSTFTLFDNSPAGSRIPIASGEITFSHRAEAWRTAFHTFLDNPVFGHGIDMPTARSMFMDSFGNYRMLTDAHNTFISVLAETGIFGFVAFMSIVGFAALGLIRWKAETEVAKAVRICLLLAMADAVFYQSFTGSYEDTRHLWVLFGMATAVCSDPSFFNNERSGQEEPAANSESIFSEFAAR